jgi:hypothetical protein
MVCLSDLKYAVSVSLRILAIRHTGTTEAANPLQQAGLIRYTRSKVTILNREKLEAASCECYEIINGEFARVLGTENG